MDTEAWLTTGEVAGALGLTHGHVRTLIARGLLPAQERAGRNFVARPDMERYRATRLGRRGPKPRTGQDAGDGAGE